MEPSGVKPPGFPGRIAVLGPGLLGGSILLALRAVSHAGGTTLWARRPEAIARASELALADTLTTDLVRAVADADLVILCTPIGVMAELAARIRPALKPGAIVTDVGSVKEPVTHAVETALAGSARFVGSHPMAGSDQSGLNAASPDLFEGAVTILTPHPGTDPDAAAAVAGLWRLLGCRIRTVDPATHDRIVAHISHLPHLTAAALVNLVCAASPDPLHFSGNGFRDTTRVASGPAAMWSEILAFNRENLRDALTRMISILEHTKTLLETPGDGRLLTFLEEAKAGRDRLGPGRGHGGV